MSRGGRGLSRGGRGYIQRWAWLISGHPSEDKDIQRCVYIDTFLLPKNICLYLFDQTRGLTGEY